MRNASPPSAPPARRGDRAAANEPVDVVDELDEDGLRIADQRQIDGVIAADALRVDIELNERAREAQAGRPVECAGLAERRAHGEKHVHLVAQDGVLGVAMAGIAEDSQRVRIVFRKDPLPLGEVATRAASSSTSCARSRRP